MKLIDSLFQLQKNVLSGHGFVATLTLHADHVIYKGHFPGFPVTPGVVQLQIVHELLENNTGYRLKLVSIGQCKFLNILNPVKYPVINISVEYEMKDCRMLVRASCQTLTNRFFKLTALYQIQDE